VKIKGQIAKAAYLFEITETGFFVLSPDEAILVTSTDGERLWTVAVSVKENDPYGLYGFPNGAAEFQQLVKSARLEVSSGADAEVLAFLFFTTVKDPHSQTVASRSQKLRHMVEDYYLSKLPEPKAESQSSAWWRSFSAAKLTNQLGLKSSGTSNGYTASIAHVRSEGGKPLQLAALDLKINRNGTCEVTGTRIIYSPPK
jgi:hypothetical protein